ASSPLSRRTGICVSWPPDSRSETGDRGRRPSCPGDLAIGTPPLPVVARRLIEHSRGMPREQVATPDAVLAAMRAALPGVETVGEPVRLPHGFGSEVWLVDTTDGSRLVKVAIRWAGGE